MLCPVPHQCHHSGGEAVYNKYGNDVIMRSDRISTYGRIGRTQLEQKTEPVLGYHPVYASHGTPDHTMMECEGVLEYCETVDIRSAQMSDAPEARVRGGEGDGKV